MEDLLRREADIAVRMQRPSQGVLVARHIGGIELGVYAHRRYLARRGTPATLDALADHVLIGYDKENAFLRSVRALVPWMQRNRFALRTDSDLAAIAALRAGFGIGFCQVGSYGMAFRGWTYDRILKHYYTGVEIVPMGSASR